ncbi:MAG: aminomethyl-transferring glycine dehydrogenase subunit GcvPB [Candidatus Sumerlaeia bacterium]
MFEKGRPGLTGVNLPEPEDEAALWADLPPKHRRRSALGLPELSEPEVVRHFTHLSYKNFSIDAHFYPLGSCTMKFNPRLCEAAARMDGFAALHPLQDAADTQGALEIMWELQQMLCALGGMDAFILTPLAGAQGEFTGMHLIRAWHKAQGRQRQIVLVPEAAHGTNPATAAMLGYRVVTVATTAAGTVDVEDLKTKLGPDVAALMLTNPNTLGVFEKDILEIAGLCHDVGAQLYYDGANLNAIAGRARPGDMGFDVVHFNLHKTFSTPHGGGGPGAGPVGVKRHLAPFLPPGVVERIMRDGKPFYSLSTEFADAPLERVGRLSAFQGNFGVVLRAWVYIRMLGLDGLRAMSALAVLAANYLKHRLMSAGFDVPYPQGAMHEFVVTLKKEAKETGVRAIDVAKRLIDFGIHPPTVYFPLLVPECFLIEPTETADKETLDAFVTALTAIRSEMTSNPDMVHNAPHTTPVQRVDEVRAARIPCLCWGGRDDE